MRSIRRQLLVSLLGAVLIALLIAAAAVYRQAREEIGEIFDYQLRQMALVLRDETFQGHRIIEPPRGFDFGVQISSDDGLRLYYLRSRVPLPAVERSGYATFPSVEGPWRVYTLQQNGLSVQVAHPMSVRNLLAAQAATRTMAPFLLLLPLLGVLIWFAVTRGLKSLVTVADSVKARSPDSLQPLPADDVPEEVQPVVTALNDLLPRLSHALEMQRAFVADAAHELRTPLTAVRLQLQLAERAQNGTERAAAFATLREGLARATHLVEQLLTLAREEPGQRRRPRVEVDVGALAAEVVGEYAPIAESKHVDVGLVRRDAGLVIDGEPEALRTVLSNLVDNAVRYTQAGGHVDVSASRTAEGIVLEVADDGPGIPAEDRERVFDRFYRRAGTEVPGSGLGLAIVRRIAERHGAAVTLDARPGGRGLAARVVFTAAAEGLRKP